MKCVVVAVVVVVVCVLLSNGDGGWVGNGSFLRYFFVCASDVPCHFL